MCDLSGATFVAHDAAAAKGPEYSGMFAAAFTPSVVADVATTTIVPAGTTAAGFTAVAAPAVATKISTAPVASKLAVEPTPTANHDMGGSVETQAYEGQLTPAITCEVPKSMQRAKHALNTQYFQIKFNLNSKPQAGEADMCVHVFLADPRAANNTVTQQAVVSVSTGAAENLLPLYSSHVEHSLDQQIKQLLETTLKCKKDTIQSWSDPSVTVLKLALVNGNLPKNAGAVGVVVNGITSSASGAQSVNKLSAARGNVACMLYGEPLNRPPGKCVLYERPENESDSGMSLAGVIQSQSHIPALASVQAANHLMNIPLCSAELYYAFNHITALLRSFAAIDKTYEGLAEAVAAEEERTGGYVSLGEKITEIMKVVHENRPSYHAFALDSSRRYMQVPTGLAQLVKAKFREEIATMHQFQPSAFNIAVMPIDAMADAAMKAMPSVTLELEMTSIHRNGYCGISYI